MRDPIPVVETPESAVEQIARRRYAEMVARLVRALGPDRLELAEDVVQEAFVRALRAWPAKGVPERPEAWLFRVAKNLAIDGLRQRAVGTRIEAELDEWAEGASRSGDAADGGAASPDEGVADDTLRMMFLCAHPSLAPDSRAALVLKTVCGFGNSAIAAALLAKEATIAQRITRAKAALAREHATFDMPPPDQRSARLDMVLEVLYLLFNEGYRAHRGESLVRVDLVNEAVRLALLLVEHPVTESPASHALLALMLLLGARIPARTNALGELLTLAQQDRAAWDPAWTRAGMWHFRRAASGEHMTPYHVEAAIASLHAAAPDYASTDWRAILAHYDRLLLLREDPIVRLNRAVAVAKVNGAAAGIAALDELGDSGPLSAYPLRLATRAQLQWDLADWEGAARSLESALDLPCTEPERRLMQRRIDACRRREPAPPW